MKTLLVGNFGAKNLGDELILLAALQDYPDAAVMTADSGWTKSFCERELETVGFPPTAFRSFARYLLSNSYRQQVISLSGFDTIVFAGGGLFAIKLRACVLWYLVFKWLKKLNPNAEFRFEHQGVDKNLGGLSKVLTKRVLAQANFVSVRDEASSKAVNALGVEPLLSTDRVWDSALFAPQKTFGNKTLVNARAVMSKPLLDGLYALENLVFVAFEASDLAFVPNTWPGDIVSPNTLTELNKLFADSDILVGERLHSLLFASKKLGTDRVKLLRTPYAEKVESFAEALGWEVF